MDGDGAGWLSLTDLCRRIERATAPRAPLLQPDAAPAPAAGQGSAPVPLLAPAAGPVRIVAIDGPGGAGKTTLASRLAEELGGVAIVHTDDFASWDVPLNWWPRLVAQVLEPLAAGRPARYQRYDWSSEQLAEWIEVAPRGWVVLEGVSASRAAFRSFLTYAIWVETPRELRLERGLSRDGEHELERWQGWMADEDDWVAREHPIDHVDLVLAGDPPPGGHDGDVLVLRERTG